MPDVDVSVGWRGADIHRASTSGADLSKGSVLNAGGYGLRPTTAAGVAGAPRDRAQSVGGGGGGGGGGLHTRMEGGVWITSRGPHPAGGPLQLQPQSAMQRMLGNTAITGQATAGAGTWLDTST